MSFEFREAQLGDPRIAAVPVVLMAQAMVTAAVAPSAAMTSTRG